MILIALFCAMMTGVLMAVVPHIDSIPDLNKDRVSGLRDEVRLLKDLLKDYERAARPVKNLTETVEVRMGIALFQIRELHWTDPNLVWNASEYGGLTRLRIPSSRLWVPDLVLYNSVDETKAATEVFSMTNLIVDDNGYVLWVVPTMLKSSCQIDVTYFPFDQQHCPLKFGSWTYDGFQLDLSNLLPHGDLSKYIPNGEWDLIDMPAKRNVEYYTCCVEPYPDVTYTVVIRRKPMFFTYNLVFPCVLLMGIGIMVFCLPPESGEKVSLGITVLLAMTVYQLLIAEAIPPTSEVVPLIGQFFGAAICLLSLSSAMTVLIMKLHFSGEHGSKVPRWLRKLVLVFLAKLMRMSKTTTYIDKAREYRTESGGADITLMNHGITRNEEAGGCGIVLTTLNHHDNSPCRQMASDIEYTCMSDKEAMVADVLSNVKQLNEEIHSRHAAQDMDEYYKSEWRKVALVLDRLLLILFFILTIFICVTIFVNVPH